jgi:multiple sugar transport system substrate-binding protein
MSKIAVSMGFGSQPQGCAIVQIEIGGGKMYQKRFSRRDFLRLGAVTTAGVALAACSGGEEEPTEAPKAQEQPTEAPAATAPPQAPEAAELSVLVWEYEEGGYQTDEYVKNNPDIKMEVVMSAGEEGKLDSMIAAGTPPDLFVLGDNNFIRYYTEGVLLNLQPLIDKDPEFSLDDYFPDILAGSQSPDGDQYALGPDFGAQLLWYNKTLLDEASVSYPDDSWTWQDLQNAAPILTKGEGAQKVFGTLPYNWWAVQFCPIWQNEGEVFSEDSKTCVIDSPEAIEALEFILGFVVDGTAASPGELAGMGMESGQLFAANRAALFPGGHWEKWQFEDTEDFEWDVTVLPKNKVAATYLHQAFWSASIDTQYPEAAWDWIKWIVSRDMSLYQCVTFGGMSPLISLAEDLANNPPEEVGPHVPKVWKALFGTARGGRNYSKVLPFSEIMDSVWDPALDKMWNEELPPAGVAQEIKAGADAILQRS